ncbi:ESX secretion-associated protein EspG [Longimycelium tulufanense]|uniref:ESX secretion-associated protein EspG n=1 Tax=Longimycelium tulufanense TaxID=907463 RepID=UPI001E45D221|nr:ESX secretion-associated protein EspG [Longimycelium tulufanense]
MSLSRAAIDMLWERIGLGTRPYPFEIPHHGETMDDRERIRNAVFSDLEGRGLVHRGRPEPELVDALTTLVRSDVAIAVIGLLDVEHERFLLARAAARGQFAVLGVLDDRMLHIDFIRHTALPMSVIRLLPPNPAGPGRSVTLARPVVRSREPDDDAGFHLETAASWTGGQARAAEVILERPRLRLGQFAVSAMDQLNRWHRLPSPSWFDTDEGRYLAQTRRAGDGQEWVTYAPADNNRLAFRLGEMLNELTQR